MKKTLLVILALATMAAIVPAKNLSLALTASYLGKSDSGFKEIYGSGGVMPGMRLEAVVWKGLSIFASYGFFAKTGATPVLADEARTRQHFMAAGAAWRGRLAEKLDWSAFAGLLFVSYREEALGEEATGTATGGEIGASLEYKVSARLFLFPFAVLMLASDAVEGTDVKLGGFQAGVGAGIRF